MKVLFNKRAAIIKAQKRISSFAEVFHREPVTLRAGKTKQSELPSECRSEM